jgi:hypothetical protein
VNFVKGLFSAGFFYFIAAMIFRWGYIHGVESEKFSRKMASDRLVACNRIIMGGQ